MSNQFTTDKWKKIQSIFDEVVDLKGSDRSRRLDELAGSGSDMRAHVESLLVFDTGDSLPSLASPATQVNTDLLHAPGTTVGKYHLLYPLAINSASEVWCAERQQSEVSDVDRVAIKFLRLANDERRVDRFRNEAMLLSQFRHPSIAEFLDCGRSPEGTPYIVTRFVVGKTITDFADHHQLTLKQRSELMMRVCDAVSYAHRFLVVHRDLKPSNILFTNDGQPVILDFGISKVVDDDSGQNSDSLPAMQLTTTAERPMTPAYASPEQIRGETVTTATDTHALGLILYELACGHHALSQAAHPDIANLFDRISSSQPLAPSHMVALPSLPLGQSTDEAVQSAPVLLAALRGTTPRQLKKQLRRGLDSVALKAAAKNPDDRYRSIAEFRNDLDNFANDLPVTATVSRSVVQSRIRKKPIRWLAMTACAATIVSVTAASLWWSGKLDDSEQRVVTEAARAESERVRAESAIEEKQTTQELLARTLEWESGTKIQNGKIALTGDLSASQLAKLARNAAESGDWQLAIQSLEAFEQRDLATCPCESTVDAAAAWQTLGRPAAGLRRLGKLIQPDAAAAFVQNATTMQELKRVVLNLLLDAGRTVEASAWAEERFHLAEWPELDGRFAIAMAQARLRIGWGEGCAEITDVLKANPVRFQLTSDQLARLSLLELENADPENNEDLSSQSRMAALGSPETVTRHGLLLSQRELEAGNTAAASAALLAVSQATESLPPMHHLQMKVRAQFASIEAERGNSQQASDALREVWNQAVAANELHTMTAATTGLKLINAGDAATADILSRLQPFRGTIAQFPYLEREFLAKEFSIAFGLPDNNLALQTARQLYELESQLWPIDSVYVAFSAAALADALTQVEEDKLAADMLDKVRKSLVGIKQATNAGKRGENFSTAFFAPILKDGFGELKIPAHTLVEFYIQHRKNQPAIQLGMLAHHVDEFEKKGKGTIAKSIARSAIDQLLAMDEIPTTEVDNALHLCRMASLLGEYNIVAPLLEQYLEPDHQHHDAAISCKILGLYHTGKKDKAFRLSKDSLPKDSVETPHVRAAIWRISQSQSNAADSQRWNDLLK